MKITSIIASSLFLPLLCFTAMAQSKTYTINPAESSIRVHVGKAGIFSGLGHEHDIGVKTFSGQVTVPPTMSNAGSLVFEIDAKSLQVLDKDVSEKDRNKIFTAMHNDVLHSAKYAQITFKSTSLANLKKISSDTYSFTLNGALNLHGIAKQIAIPVSLKITQQQLRATGEYTLKQTDYGIKPYSAGGGTVKVKNEVIIKFNIVAKP